MCLDRYKISTVSRVDSWSRIERSQTTNLRNVKSSMPFNHRPKIANFQRFKRDLPNLILPCVEPVGFISVARRLLQAGSSKPWEELLFETIGSRKLSTEPLKKYFQPLTDWLKEQNKSKIFFCYCIISIKWVLI